MKKINIIVLILISLTFFVACDDIVYFENVSLNKTETEVEVGEKKVMIANLNPKKCNKQKLRVVKQWWKCCNYFWKW